MRNKYLIKLKLLLFSILSFGPLISQEVNLDSLVFKTGETITYKIYYNWEFVWIPAGEVQFRVTEREDHFEFIAEGRSYPSYDSFFKVRDDYISRVGKADLIPMTLEGQFLRGNTKDMIVFHSWSKGE